MGDIDKNLPEHEDALRELLSFIDGSAGHGVGIRSYTDNDPRQRKIHEGCLELERRGKIERHFEDGAMVIWMPCDTLKAIRNFDGVFLGGPQKDVPTYRYQIGRSLPDEVKK